LAASSSDGNGAGPFIAGFATATAGAVGGVVSVLVAPIDIVVLLARSVCSVGAVTAALSVPTVTTALAPMIAARNWYLRLGFVMVFSRSS
jgi:hypothetical protein